METPDLYANRFYAYDYPEIFEVYKPRILILALDQHFLEQTKRCLAQIQSREIGQKLIEKFGQRFQEKLEANNQKALSERKKLIDRPILIMPGPKNAFNDDGDHLVIYFSSEVGTYLNKNIQSSPRKPFIGLAHELIHAKHFLYCKVGKRFPIQTLKSHKLQALILFEKIWSDPEEYKTIEGDGKGVTENKIREEHGFPRRFSHYSGNIENREGLKASKLALEDLFKPDPSFTELPEFTLPLIACTLSKLIRLISIKKPKERKGIDIETHLAFFFACQINEAYKEHSPNWQV